MKLLSVKMGWQNIKIITFIINPEIEPTGLFFFLSTKYHLVN